MLFRCSILICILKGSHGNWAATHCLTKARAKFKTIHNSECMLPHFVKKYKMCTIFPFVSGTKQLVSYHHLLSSPRENQTVWNVRVCNIYCVLLLWLLFVFV